MTERERMLAGKLYNPYKMENSPQPKIRAACRKFNESNYWEDFTALDELCKLFAAGPDDMVLTPPFYCERGDNITFGKHFYAGNGLTIIDTNTITFGDNCYLGSNVTISAAARPFDKEVRNSDLEYSKPVTIGSSVWIGSSTMINPGVKIGDDVVIRPGSVVVTDIPDHSVAEGNPCRVTRKLTDKDHNEWMEQLVDYMNDPD